MESLRRVLIDACRDDLIARGEAGRAALDCLTGEARGAEAPVALGVASARALAALERPGWSATPAALRDVRSARGCVVDLGAPPRALLLGDVHGRWDLVAPALEAAGLIDAAGHWCAEPGACLVQVGDLLDADLGHAFAQGADPRGERLLAAFAPWIEAARSGLPDSAALSALLARAATAPDAACWLARQQLVGALMTWHTLGAFQRLEAEAAAAGGRVVVLMGNHELDLLTGRLWWSAGQKRAWLALIGGAELEASLRDAGGDPAAIDALALAHPALAWLARRPLLARVGPVLAMHGGPTRALTRALTRANVRDLDGLGRWLEARAPRALGAPFYAEGASLVSPDRRRDDLVGDPGLARPWLVAAGADLLAVGHSPFLGLDPRRWADTADPDVARQIGQLERLGPLGAIIKLDTNLKRGGRAELLEVDRQRGALVGLDAAGHRRSLLAPGERLDVLRSDHRAQGALAALLEEVDTHRGPALIDLSPPGLAGEAFGRLMTARAQLEAALDAGAREALGVAIGAILQAGPDRLDPLLDDWARAMASGDARGALRATTWRRERLLARVEQLASVLEPEDGVLRVLLDARAATIDGVAYRLIEPVVAAAWRRLQAEGQPACPVIAAELVAWRGQPAVALDHLPPGQPASAHTERAALPDDAPRTWRALEDFARAALARAALHPSARRVGATPQAPARGRPLGGDAAPEAARDAAPGDAQGAAPSGARAATSRDAPRWRRSPRPAALPSAALQALLAHNAPALTAVAERRGSSWRPAQAQASDLTLDADDLRPGWGTLDAPWRLRVVLTPSRELLLADTTFMQPEARTACVQLDAAGAVDGPPRSHVARLLERWAPPPEVVLYAQVKTHVARLLDAGEPERLRGAGAELTGAPGWRGGCYLFTGLAPETARHFSDLNPRAARFTLPRDTLEAWLKLGWLNLNLMVADFGAAISPDDRWGAPEVGLEVVACGAEGVRALWDHRAR